MKRLHRYVLGELFNPLGLSLFLFTFVLLSRRLDDLVVLLNVQDVDYGVVVQVICLLLPFVMTMTLPMGLMIACLTVFSRWSSDRELLIMRTSGINPFRIIKPLLVVAVVSTLLVMYCTTFLVPWTYSAFRKTMFTVAAQMTTQLKTNTFNPFGNNLMVYVRERGEKPGFYKGVTLFYTKDNQIQQMLTARDGQVDVDIENSAIHMALNEGTYYSADQKDITHFYIATFGQWTSTENLGRILKMPGNENRKPQELNLSELKSAISKKEGKEQRKLRVEYMKRFSMPFSCLVVTLMGISLGAMVHLKNKTLGFFFGVILIGVYWILMSVGESLGIRGILPPEYSVWLPNIVLGGLGVWLTWKMCRQ